MPIRFSVLSISFLFRSSEWETRVRVRVSTLLSFFFPFFPLSDLGLGFSLIRKDLDLGFFFLFSFSRSGFFSNLAPVPLLDFLGGSEKLQTIEGRSGRSTGRDLVRGRHLRAGSDVRWRGSRHCGVLGGGVCVGWRCRRRWCFPSLAAPLLKIGSRVRMSVG